MRFATRVLMSRLSTSRSSAQQISGVLCACAWLLELGYLISERFQSGGALIVNGVNILSNEARAATYWFIAVVVGLCFGFACLLIRRLWPVFALASAAIFFGDRFIFGAWGRGLSRAYESGWFVAKRLNLKFEFLIDYIIMPITLSIVAALALFAMGKLVVGTKQVEK